MKDPPVGRPRDRSVRLESASSRACDGEPSQGRIRIAIAGEYPIFRHGLRRLLEAEPGFAFVGEEGDVARVPALVDACGPDVLLLGFGASRRRVIEVLHALRESPVLTILLTDRIDTPDVSEALHAGARGVVLKESAPDVLFAGIRRVVAGEFWLGHAGAAQPAAGLKKAAAARRRSRAFGLTAREVEIIRAVVSGCSNREIARRTHISENTVKSHLSHIFDKCGASTRVELALFAAHHRLLDGV